MGVFSATKVTNCSPAWEILRGHRGLLCVEFIKQQQNMGIYKRFVFFKRYMSQK